MMKINKFRRLLSFYFLHKPQSLISIIQIHPRLASSFPEEGGGGGGYVGSSKGGPYPATNRGIRV